MLLKLLGLPVTVPVAGFRFCLNQLIELAEQELLDDTPVREALLLLTLQLEEGDIDEAEYRDREAELMVRLREIRAYREQRARGAAGLPPTDESGGPALRASGGGFVVELHDQYGPGDDPARRAPDGSRP
jgi:hypothetical protein